MKTMYKFVGIIVLIFALTIQTSYSFVKRKISVKPTKSVVALGYDRSHIEVKFMDELDIALDAKGVPYDREQISLRNTKDQSLLRAIVDNGGSWKRMTDGIEDRMDQIVYQAEQNLNRDLSDINNYFIITVPENISTVDWLEQLNSLPDVEIALAMPLPMRAPVMPPASFQGSQGYLNAAPDGIGAIAAWALPGGSGWPSAIGPVKIADFEYSWNLSHNDFSTVFYGFPPLETPVDPFSDDNHGTGVIGVYGSLNNGFGTTGGAYSTLLTAAPTNFVSGWNIGLAMAWYGYSWVGPGGVLVIEQQMAGPNYPGAGAQDGLVPIEWWKSWYDMVVLSVANGTHVVMAAGNGQEDLDDAAYSVGNGGHWPFLAINNSGAIIVGAGAVPAGFGGSDTDRSKLWYSNYGSRLDLQGWGENVMTTGYGSYYSAEGKNYWYTSGFGGTSSATPIVASAVAILESLNREANATTLPPATMISILIASGSPQQAGTYPISDHIGPRPNLATAIPMLPSSNCCDLAGDFDGNSAVDIADLTATVNWMFKGGATAACINDADVNASCAADVADLTYRVNFMFKGGPVMVCGCVP